MSKNWNADDWHLYLSQLLDTRTNFPNGMNIVALKIAETMDDLRVPDGFMILPVEATAMMALRGYQAPSVFEKNDYFGDYIDAAELPAALAPTHKFDDDERGWLLAAAAYRGCVNGYIETLERLAKDPTDEIATSWNKPLASTFTPENGNKP